MGGAHSLSTVNKGTLESFELFYEELKPFKPSSSRIRRARPSLVV